MPGTINTSKALVSVALAFSMVAVGGCVGIPEQPAACGGPEPCAADEGNELGTAVPIPVADATEPTPVRYPMEGDGDSGTVVGGDSVPALVWVPWLGWASTIELLDLLATGGLGSDFDTATSNPSDMTDLELLCRNEGLPHSYCWSRYGGL